MEVTVGKQKTAYENLCDRLRILAASEGRSMSEAEIHKSARNLMGYVELAMRIDQKISRKP